MITITHTRNKFYVEGVPRPHNPRGTHEWLIKCRYAIGQLPRRYPVPAVRQWFEFAYSRGPYNPGTDLFEPYVTLIHCVQERFDG